MRPGRTHVVYTALAFVVVASAVILYLAYVGRCPLRENARHVRAGMTAGEVGRILGPPTMTVPVPRREIRIWRMDQTQCVVLFDADGNVREVTVSDVTGPGVLRRLLWRLGLPW
jgi:outer membrane protein assembly factor BamE (lipoprotein component of BamABCDE complex)